MHMRHYKGKCIKNPVFLSFGFNSRFMKIHSGLMKNIKNPEGPAGHEYQEKLLFKYPPDDRIARADPWPDSRPIELFQSHGRREFRSGPDVRQISFDICQMLMSYGVHASPPKSIGAPSDRFLAV